MRSLSLVALALVTFTACPQEETTTLAGGDAEACTLTNETLDGTAWVMAEALPDRSNRDNPKARLRFHKEGDMMTADYSVASLTGMYDYECKLIRDGKEWKCVEEPRLASWCLALEANKEGSCTPDELKKMGAEGWSTDEEIAKGIEDAKKAWASAKEQAGEDEQTWKRFLLENNNLGNKLQGMLFAEVMPKSCQLKVTDMYMTIYNGKRMEDSNPVGTNPFNQTQDELLWENCMDSNLADHASAEFPPIEQLTRGNQYMAPDLTVHYKYVGQKWSKAEEGCTYSYDSWAEWKPVEKGVAVEPGEEGVLTWQTSHTYASVIDDQAPVPFHMVRHAKCEGKDEVTETACNVVRVMP